MTIVAAAQQLLLAAPAIAYLFLAILLVMSRRGGTVRTLLAIGCGATALWAISGIDCLVPHNEAVNDAVELLRATAWCGLLVGLLQRQFPGGRSRIGLIGTLLAIIAFAIGGIVAG